MSLTATDTVLDGVFTTIGVDAVGKLKAQGMYKAMGTWMAANCKLGPGTMTGTGGNVTGFGRLHFYSGETSELGFPVTDAAAAALCTFSSRLEASTSFGAALAAGVPATDPPGIAKWTAIADALMVHLIAYAQVIPSGFTYVTPTGTTISGVGTIGITNVVFTPLLSFDLGFTDAANILTWDGGIGLALQAHIVSKAVANGLGFLVPAVGGPLTLAGTIS